MYLIIILIALLLMIEITMIVMATNCNNNNKKPKNGSNEMTPECCKKCDCCKVKTLVPGALAIMDREQRSSDIITRVGRLVDLRCYSMDLRNVHDDHLTWDNMKMKNCAKFCAMNGIPVGLLDHDKLGGKVYVLLAPSIGLAGHMDKIAKVTGRVMKDSGGLIPTVPIEIQMETTGEFKDIDLCTPM